MIGASNRNIGKIGFQDQVVYRRTFIVSCLYTGATEKPRYQHSHLWRRYESSTQKLVPDFEKNHKIMDCYWT